jgi:hypothetical protein
LKNKSPAPLAPGFFFDKVRIIRLVKNPEGKAQKMFKLDAYRE